jgi:2-polyprenyl-6-methoxyphenol hydroxylase-like FAD-dependent oxidoreductase
MAGLLAARVLSDHFDEVTLMDRDSLPSGPEPRKGVPQGRHVHVLLARGHAILEELFPGLTDELHAAGAVNINGGREIAWFYGGGWRTCYETDLTFIAMSRPLLEAQVGARVRALPNVKVLEEVRTEAPIVEQGVLTGAQLGDGRQGETIGADLLVDASGRGSAMPRWLEHLRCGSPVTNSIPAKVAYATCMFPRSDSGPNWRALLVNNPGARRAAFCMAVEGDRWLVTLASLFDEPSPRDHEAFRSYAKSLPVQELHELVDGLEPLSNVVPYRFPGSQRRRFERMRSLPAGLFAIGDAVCSFNPVYGQGMTVAAIEAEALAHVLADAKHRGQLDLRLTRRWYRAVARIVDVAWQGVAIEDYRFPELADQRPTALRPLQWYMERVHRATHSNGEVTDQFYRVMSFLDSPTKLFRPRIAANVLRAG